MILHAPQFTRRQRPQLARDVVVSLRESRDGTPTDKQHARFDDRFSRVRVLALEFKAEDVAGRMKGLNLAPSVGQDSVGADSAADDLVEMFGRIALAVNLLVATEKRVSDLSA